MPAIFKIFLIIKAVYIGWIYWFGDRKSLSESELKEFEQSTLLIIPAFIIYSPILIPMYIFKGIYYLINSSQKKKSTTTVQQAPHLQTCTPPIVAREPKIQLDKKLECPRCHNKVYPGQNFCINCGYDLSEKVVLTPAVDKPILGTDKPQKPDRVNIFLKSTGNNLMVVKATKEILGFDLRESKDIVDSTPTYLPGSFERSIALKYVEELRKIGAVAEIK